MQGVGLPRIALYASLGGEPTRERTPFGFQVPAPVPTTGYQGRNHGLIKDRMVTVGSVVPLMDPHPRSKYGQSGDSPFLGCCAPRVVVTRQHGKAAGFCSGCRPLDAANDTRNLRSSLCHCPQEQSSVPGPPPLGQHFVSRVPVASCEGAPRGHSTEGRPRHRKNRRRTLKWREDRNLRPTTCS